MDRPPAVAGRFYPESSRELRVELGRLIAESPQRRPVKGIVAPHAGYVYSGKVAGEVYSRIDVPETVVVLCPNHTGLGPAFSVWPDGRWRTPLGDVTVDADLVARILRSSPLFQPDTQAHVREHAIEVQLPFLQVRRPGVKVVAIVVRSQHLRDLQEAGQALGRALAELGRPVLLVASSDMTHYESKASAEKKDRLAIDRILQLDAEGLFQTVQRHDITMCGYAPTVVMLTAVKGAGAATAELVRYATSGDVTGDDSDVVAYAGVTIA